MRVIVLLAALLPAVAQAHAFLVRSAPPKRAVLRDPPQQVELWFNERLEPSFAALALSGSGGTDVVTEQPLVAPDDRKRLTLQLPPLKPGTYTVRYRVLSVDGHVAEDSFTFTVR